MQQVFRDFGISNVNIILVLLANNKIIFNKYVKNIEKVIRNILD